MSIETGQTKLDVMQRKIQRLKSELATEVQDVMKVMFKEFFEDNPRMKMISWSQYTPYFNDGDACYFSYNSLTWHSCEFEDDTGEVVEQDELGGYVRSKHKWWSTDEGKKAVKSAKQLDTFLNKFEDELETAFGDHCKVYARADGFTVEEYDHD